MFTDYFNHETGDSQWHKPADSDPELKSLNANLPSGWEALRDDDEGRVYYFDFNTEESSWERPANAGPPAPLEDAAEGGGADEAQAQAAAASAKGLVLPDRKAARRHSVAKALLMQNTKRAPRMLLPMAALAEDDEAGDEGGAALPSGAPSKKDKVASRKASMVAKEDAAAATSVKHWLKVSDSTLFMSCGRPPNLACRRSYHPPLSQMGRSGVAASVF